MRVPLRRRVSAGTGWVLLALVGWGVISRWITRSELVQSWDAGNFVLALDRFDLDRHQPHLPGVFWWLITLGRLGRPLVGGDGVKALELVNALAAAIAIPFGWHLGFRCGGVRTAWWMVGLLVSAPLLWFYASQPLSYGAELGWVMAIACSAWCVAAGEERWLLPLALLMATAGGIRPNTPIFLLPLVIVCCWRGIRHGLAAWRLLVAIALGLGVLVAWGDAFLQEVGGFSAFWPQLMAWRGDHTEQATSHGPLANGWLLIKTIALTAPAGIPLALVRWRSSSSEPGGGTGADHQAEQRWIRLFLTLWLLPSTLYLVLVHFTRMGHATTLLPGFLLLLSMGLAGRGLERGRWRWPRDLLIVTLLQSLLFLVVPGDRFAPSLRAYDREWGIGMAAVRAFDPATTLVVTTGRPNARAYRLTSTHLSAYDHAEADLELDQRHETIRITPPLRQVVVLDRGLALALPDLPGVHSRMLIPGRLRLIVVPVPPGGLEVGRRRIALSS